MFKHHRGGCERYRTPTRNSNSQNLVCPNLLLGRPLALKFFTEHVLYAKLQKRFSRVRNVSHGLMRFREIIRDSFRREGYPMLQQLGAAFDILFLIYVESSRNLEAARFRFRVLRSLCNLTGVSAAMLPNRLSNFITT